VEVPFVGIFDHQHLEHAGQADEGRRRQENQRHPAPAALSPFGLRRGVDLRQHRLWSAGKRPDNEDPHRHERDEFYDRFDRDGHHNAVVTFVRVQGAGAKNNGKKREAGCDPDRGCCEVFGAPTAAALFGENREGQRNRLQLQGNIGCRSNNGDDRDHDAERR